MARNPQEAALALHRFGFGPRAGSIEAIADDPRGALIAELDRPGAGQITNPDLPTSGAANRAVFEYNAERNAEKKRPRQDSAQAAMEAAPAKPEAEPLPRQLFRAEARARIDAALDAEIGFVERFHRRHEELYTYSLPDQETVLVNARVAVAGLLSALPQEPDLPEAPPAAPRSKRRTYLDDWVTSSLYDFDALAPKQTIAGPAIIESAMTTVLLRLGETAKVTALGWLDITVPPGSTRTVI